MIPPSAENGHIRQTRYIPPMLLYCSCQRRRQRPNINSYTTDSVVFASCLPGAVLVVKISNDNLTFPAYISFFSSIFYESFYLKKKKNSPLHFLKGKIFIIIILPFHFCLETPIFFSPLENYVNVTFLSLKKKICFFACSIFAGNTFFLKK